MLNMALKLITFDVTGTILLLKESVGHQYAKIGLRYGMEVPPDILTKNFYIVFKKLLVEEPNFGGSSGIGWPEWWRRLVFQTFKNSLSAETPVESFAMDKISSDLIEVYKTEECWKLSEGAEILLDNLGKKHLRLGVISNYDPRLEDILKNLNVLKYFSFVLSSYDAKCQKPDPEIFKAVEVMNKPYFTNLKKSEILHIGDNPKLDFMGARNVGWNALLIAETPTTVTEQFPDIEKEWIVNNIGEIYQNLENKKLL